MEEVLNGQYIAARIVQMMFTINGNKTAALHSPMLVGRTSFYIYSFNRSKRVKIIEMQEGQENGGESIGADWKSYPYSEQEVIVCFVCYFKTVTRFSS